MQKRFFCSKESDVGGIESKLEEEQALVGRLQRQIKEMHERRIELEEEVECERQGKIRVRFYAKRCFP